MKKIFGVFDVKAGHVVRPFFDESNVNAIRGFTIAANEPKGNYFQFPDDFALVELGSFDASTGTISPLERMNFLCTARELLKPNASEAQEVFKQ